MIDCKQMKMLLVMIAFLLCGCSAEHSSGFPEVESKPSLPVSKSPRTGALGSEDAKALWTSSRVINYDIAISYEPSGFLEPARRVLVKVRNGTPISIEVPDETDSRGRLGFYGPYKTVDSMFERIENLRERSPSAILNVKYNKTYGYPEEIKYSEPNPDSSFTFRVLKFQPVASVGG